MAYSFLSNSPAASSENVEKVTNPGLKRVYRAYNAEGHSICDVLAKYDEEASSITALIDPDKPWKKYSATNLTFKEMQQCMMKEGVRCLEQESMKVIRDRLKQQLENELWEEEQRFENPHSHYLDMSPAYYQEKMKLLEEGSCS